MLLVGFLVLPEEIEFPVSFLPVKVEAYGIDARPGRPVGGTVQKVDVRIKSAMKGTGKILVFKKPELRTNLLWLLSKIKGSDSAHQAFIENPNGTITCAFTKINVTKWQASDA